MGHHYCAALAAGQYRSLAAVIGCPSQLTFVHCSGAGIGQLWHYKRWDAARQGMPFMFRRPLPMPSFMHALLLCVCFSLVHLFFFSVFSDIVCWPAMVMLVLCRWALDCVLWGASVGWRGLLWLKMRVHALLASCWMAAMHYALRIRHMAVA
jgi:hypothetical protein